MSAHTPVILTHTPSISAPETVDPMLVGHRVYDWNPLLDRGKATVRVRAKRYDMP